MLDAQCSMLNVGHWALSIPHWALFVVIVLRQSFQLFEEHQRAMGGDLEPLPARLTGNVVVDANQMILHLLEHRAVARIRAAWNLRLLGASHPADAVVVGAAAPRALEPRRPLLGLFGKELSLVHVMTRVGVR